MPSTGDGGGSSIPLTAHFIWLGDELPWVHVLALRSASDRGGFERVVLHHDRDLSGAEHFGALAAIPRVELRLLEPDRVFGACEPHATALAALYPRLPRPAMRSDLLRLAILYAEGGVYLDIDTVTVGSLRELCAGVSAFCGEEHVAFPLRVKRSRNPAVHLAAEAKHRLRSVLGRVPRGWAAFRAIQALYPRAINNAVLGSVARGRLVSRALERLVSLPAPRQVALYGIGPHLLQELASECSPAELRVHPPPVFYPLGPEMSRHWFHLRGAPLEEILQEDTRVVHWYGSVKTRHLVAQIDPAHVRAHAGRQPFSALALPFTHT